MRAAQPPQFAQELIRIRLPHGETNPEKIYSFPNPHHEPEATWAVRYWIYGDGPQPTKEQLGQVLAMADAYKDLTMYELGQECCVRKLRDIWRALRGSETRG